MLVTDDILQGLVADALLNKTVAAARVYTPRTWPTTADEMPVLLVQSPSEEKVSEGRVTAQSFTVLATIRIVGRIYAKAGAGDAGAIAAQAALGVLKRQIAIAVINDYEIRRHIQQYKFVRSMARVDSQQGGLVFGELVMDLGLEFYQGPEDFAPVEGDPLEEIAIYADLLNIFSPTNIFAGTPFAADATPPPRTSGPDGRAEGAALIILPQP